MPVPTTSSRFIPCLTELESCSPGLHAPPPRRKIHPVSSCCRHCLSSLSNKSLSHAPLTSASSSSITTCVTFFVDAIEADIHVRCTRYQRRSFSPRHRRPASSHPPTSLAHSYARRPSYAGAGSLRNLKGLGLDRPPACTCFCRRVPCSVSIPRPSTNSTDYCRLRGKLSKPPATALFVPVLDCVLSSNKQTSRIRLLDSIRQQWGIRPATEQPRIQQSSYRDRDGREAETVSPSPPRLPWCNDNRLLYQDLPTRHPCQ